MPELPEVETVAQQLDPLVAGQLLRRLEVYDDLLRLTRRDTAPLDGSRVSRVFRHGKQVAFEFGPSRRQTAHFALVHLRMTGRLIWYPGRQRPKLQAGREPRARFVFSGGSVYFFDVRRFGTIALADSLESHSGWQCDPTAPEFTVDALASLLGGARQELKAFLLRQDRLVGIGNIYASEILYRAGLHPQRPADGLTSAELRQLHRATRDVLASAIRHCGTTFSDFQQSSGEVGGFQRYLRVYQRDGQRCRKCGGEIVRIVQQQRSSFFCPQCQAAE